MLSRLIVAYRNTQSRLNLVQLKSEVELLQLLGHLVIRRDLPNLIRKYITIINCTH